MARYSGVIGYAKEAELVNGIWENNEVIERHYYGDVSRISRSLQNGSDVLPDFRVNNSISVVADAYAFKHFHLIKYIKWEGTNWAVSSIEVQRPRLVITLGGVYNGPTA